MCIFKFRQLLSSSLRMKWQKIFKQSNLFTHDSLFGGDNYYFL